MRLADPTLARTLMLPLARAMLTRPGPRQAGALAGPPGRDLRRLQRARAAHPRRGRRRARAGPARAPARHRAGVPDALPAQPVRAGVRRGEGRGRDRAPRARVGAGHRRDRVRDRPPGGAHPRSPVPPAAGSAARPSVLRRETRRRRHDPRRRPPARRAHRPHRRRLLPGRAHPAPPRPARGPDAVVVLDVAPPPSALPGVRHRLVDLTLPVADRKVLEVLQEEEVDTVVHAAFYTNPRRDSAYSHELESIGTLHLMAACAAAGVRHVVQRSFTAVYGARGQNPSFLTEQTGRSRTSGSGGSATSWRRSSTRSPSRAAIRAGTWPWCAWPRCWAPACSRSTRGCSRGGWWRP